MGKVNSVILWGVIFHTAGCYAASGLWNKEGSTHDPVRHTLEYMDGRVLFYVWNENASFVAVIVTELVFTK